MAKSASIKAIELARSVFESIQGGLGLLKFSIEELIPTNGDNGGESMKWDIICSFIENLQSSTPSRFKASVDLNNNTVTIQKLTDGDTKMVGAYKVTKTEPAPEPSVPEGK
ncbi:MAG: hypothetical protein WCX74_02630 [Candidatus Paceibacterota bacterium]